MTSIESNPESKYAGVPLPEIRIMTERLLSADSTEKVLNALMTVEHIRQINIKGESLPATINSGPNRGIANNHPQRKVIKYGEQEIELRHLVGDFFLEVLAEDQEMLDAVVAQVDSVCEGVMPFGYTITVGRYSKYRPSLADY